MVPLAQCTEEFIHMANVGLTDRNGFGAPAARTTTYYYYYCERAGSATLSLL